MVLSDAIVQPSDVGSSLGSGGGLVRPWDYGLKVEGFDVLYIEIKNIR